jgi:hypothetical protein
MERDSFDLIFGPLCVAVVFNLTAGWLFAWLISGVLNRPRPEALTLGLFLGPIGWLLIGFLDREYEKQCGECGGGLPDPPRKRCPHCGQLLAAPEPLTPPPVPRAPPIERPAVSEDELLDLLGKPSRP